MSNTNAHKSADETPVDGELLVDDNVTNESAADECVATGDATDEENDSDSECSSDDEHPLEFDVDALKRISAERLQKSECMSVVKLGEGSFNKAFLLTMDDGFECVARLALPCFPRFKTESEVATMQFVAERTSIRVPEVYAWDANSQNPIGAEYILMEKIPGEPLDTIWNDLSLEKKKGIVLQLIDVLLQLFDITDTALDKIGSLYKGNEDHVYHVGLIVSDLFFAEERANMDLDRGPWMNTREYLTAVVRGHADYLKNHYASTLDDNNVQSGLTTCTELEAILPAFCPDNATLERLCLHHLDIHTGNIMLQQTDDIGDWKISGIIDWEAAGVYPAWECAWYPKFIEGENRDVEASDASDWFDEDQFQQLLVETELRRFFRSETTRRSPAFGIAMDQGAKTRAFENQAIFARDYPGHVRRWISGLGSNGDGWE